MISYNYTLIAVLKQNIIEKYCAIINFYCQKLRRSYVLHYRFSDIINYTPVFVHFIGYLCTKYQ